MEKTNETMPQTDEHSEDVQNAEPSLETSAAEEKPTPEEKPAEALMTQNTGNETTETTPEEESSEMQENEAAPSAFLSDAEMEEFNKEDESFSTDRYSLVKPIINAPTADYKQFRNMLMRWKNNKQYFIFIMLKTGISEEMVRSLIMKVRDEKNAKNDNDLSFLAALSVLTGNEFLHKAYPTFEECYTAQTLREMMRDYYNGPTREDRDRYEASLARADISQRTIDEMEKQLERYQEIFLSNNETAIKREESIREDYRAMMEKDREAIEKEMTTALNQKEMKIKELEEANRELEEAANEAQENKTHPANIVSVLKERDDYANEIQRLKKEAAEKDKRINALEASLKTYQEEEKEKEIRSKVMAELERKYEEKAARITAQKEKEIEKKDEELFQARQMISRMKEEAAPLHSRSETSEEHPLSEKEMQRIAEYVKDKITERDAHISNALKEEDEEEILQELMEAQDIYDPSEIVILDDNEEKTEQPAADDTAKETEAPITDDILPQHMPIPVSERFRKEKSEEKPPLFFRKHWKARKETEEIEDIGFRVIASDEYSDVQKNLIQEAIDNNLSLKNLRKLADPSIPEKNMSQALHYFLRQENKAS